MPANEINSNVEALGALVEQIRGSFEILSRLESLLDGLEKRPATAKSRSSAAASPAGRSSGTGASDNRAVRALGPAGFLWKPTSDSDGKLVVLLPSGLTNRASGVKILSPNGQIVATGAPKGAGNGNRLHFRFDRPGGAFPPGCIVEITMRDGSKQQIRIEKPSVRTEGR